MMNPMPGCSMKIFSGDPSQKEVAENVKIGDPLTLVVTLDEQEFYGIRVTDCLVSITKAVRTIINVFIHLHFSVEFKNRQIFEYYSIHRLA